MAQQGNAEGSLPIPGIPYTPYVPQRNALNDVRSLSPEFQQYLHDNPGKLDWLVSQGFTEPRTQAWDTKDLHQDQWGTWRDRWGVAQLPWMRRVPTVAQKAEQR